MRARDDVDGDDFADAAAGFGAGVDRGANGRDVALERDRHQAAADLVLLDELTFAAFSAASHASTAATMPLVSINPIASPFAMVLISKVGDADVSVARALLNLWQLQLPQLRSIQFAFNTATVCRATINSSFVGTIQISVFDSTLLIFFSWPRTWFFAGSSTMPAHSRLRQIASRMATPFSPMPPVKTSTSQPPSTTRYAPM